MGGVTLTAADAGRMVTRRESMNGPDRTADLIGAIREKPACVIRLEWDTTESLPEPPPLQQWIEVSYAGDTKRTFVLAPYCPGKD